VGWRWADGADALADVVLRGSLAGATTGWKASFASTASAGPAIALHG
jgi:hypothetical protein